jgi:hypothetical protein
MHVASIQVLAWKKMKAAAVSKQCALGMHHVWTLYSRYRFDYQHDQQV